MRHFISGSSGRVARLLAACALLAGGAGGLTLMAAGPADAAACSTTTPTTTDCTKTATANLGAGTLSLAASDTLGWAVTLNGLAQDVADVTAADEGYTVDDARGSGVGWKVTAAATTFTSTTPAATLPDTDTFSTNGSVTSVSDTTAPSNACTSASSCTVPTTNVTFPQAITTAATSPTPVTIYNATAGTGLGSIDIGGSTATNPVGWWIHVPANATAATYTSTVTLAVATGP